MSSYEIEVTHTLGCSIIRMAKKTVRGVSPADTHGAGGAGSTSYSYTLETLLLLGFFFPLGK